MAVISFADSIGSTVAFDPAVDVLSFGGTYTAASLLFEASGNDLLVHHGSLTVRLATVAFGNLTAANFTFVNGSVAVFDADGAQSLPGTGGGDYFDIRNGGADLVDAGGGDDRVVAGAELDAADRIDGGAGTKDELHLSGDLTVELADATVTGVERIVVGPGSVSLDLAAGTVAAATAATGQMFTVDATAQTESDQFTLNASRVTGQIAVKAGGGDDVVTGGTNADSLHGGDGSDRIIGDAGAVGGDDTLAGGLGTDTLTGGVGADTFRFGFVSGQRTESSPATPDLVTDFQGAGADGGDIIDLPSFNLANQPLAFNAASVPFTFNGFGSSGLQLPADLVGDGFIDVVWKFVPASGGASARFEVWVDSNDDGQFSETDILIHLDRAGGTATALVLGDFSQNFKVWRGTQGNDAYAGDGEANQGYGLGGNDTLSGGGGTDRLYGGDGTDLIAGEDGADLLSGGAGSDTITGGAGNDTLTADTSGVSGRPGSLDGAFHTNRLEGGAGNDTLTGGAGVDTLDGGDDADSLTGGTGSDSLLGGAGTDRMDGGAGADTLFGGAGADTFVIRNFGAATVDSKLSAADTFADFSAADGDKIDLESFTRGYLSGPGGSLPLVWRGALAARDASAGLPTGTALPGEDIGADFYQVWWIPATQGGAAAGGWLVTDLNRDFRLDASDLVIRVGSAQKPVTLTRADFVEDTFVAIVGTAGNDTLAGADAEDDIIFGLAGNDALQGLEGKDSILGQDGNDTLGGGGSDDTLRGGLGQDSLDGGDGDDELYGDFSVPQDKVPNDNALNGGAGDDYLVGARGSDTLNGGADNDLLHAQLGADVQIGGGGADIFGFRNFQVDTVESTLGTMDLIQDFSAAEGDKIYLYLPKRGYLEGFEGTLPLLWRGSAGTREVSQGLSLGMQLGGEDIGTGFHQVWWVGATQGGAAAGGWFIVDLNSDFKLDETDMAVRVGSVANPTAIGRSDFQAGTFVAIVGTGGNDNLVGADAEEDLIFGLAGNDVLDGRDGKDKIYGGTGDDRLFGGLGNDSLLGMAGNDTLNGSAGDDVLAADNFGSLDLVTNVNVLNGHTGLDTLTGAVGRDTLLGGSDADSLVGAAGDDRLDGEGGADRLLGGAGADLLVGGTEADRFVFGRFTDKVRETGLGAMDTLADFSPDDGDKVELTLSGIGTINGPGGSLPLIWRGALPAREPGGLQAGLALPGEDVGGDFYQVWWIPATEGGAAAGGWLVVDLNRDFKLDATDFVARVGSVANPVTLTASDFAPNTFAVTAGTAGLDRIRGDASANLIFGLGGVDLIYGFAGDDKLHGGDGNDRLFGGTDDDQLHGGAGNDSLLGEDGDDTLAGGAGDDTLDGGNDKDRLSADSSASLDTALSVNLLRGGFGNDTLTGGLGNDALNGDGDDDSLSGAGGDDRLDGGDGADTLRGDDGGDRLAGGAGRDRLHGGAGTDELLGGTEADVFVYDDLRASVPGSSLTDLDTIADFSAAEGDKIELTLSSPGVINGPAGNLPLVWRGAVAARDASAGPPTGVALPGQDAGAECYQVWWVPATQGGAAAGGWLVVDLSRDFTVGADDLVVRIGSAANPVALSDLDFAAGTFASLIGTPGNDSLVGGVAGDLIYGLPGHDVLDGLGGHDRLFGNEGNDRLLGGDGMDTLNGGSGNDTMEGGNDRDLLAADSATNRDTAASSNRLDGGAGNDLLEGGVGRDTLLGGSDDDSLSGGEGADSLDGGTGNDALQGGSGSDRIAYDASDALVYAGEDANALDQDVLVLLTAVAVDLASRTDQVAGGGRTSGFEGVDFSAVASAVSVKGDASANTLIGSGFGDTLGGSGGNDTLTGGGGADSFLFDSALGTGNVDTVTDFSVPLDTIHLENAVFGALTQTGTLSAAAFRLGTAAQDGDDRIGYDVGTGRLWYDADGNGAGASAVHFATLTGTPAVDRFDFLVV